MAQNIRIELLCDACKAEGIHNDEAETLPPVSLHHKAPLVLDLCERHRKEMFDPLAQLLDTEGRNEDGKRRRRKPKKAEPEPEPTLVELEANICPDCNQTFNTQQGLNAHWTRKHDKEYAKRKAAEQKPPIHQPGDDYVCPEPGCGKTFTKAQGLNMHRVRAHAYRKSDDAA